jgi:hypothetical protein
MILGQALIQFDEVSDALPRGARCRWYGKWIRKMLQHEAMAQLPNAINVDVRCRRFTCAALQFGAGGRTGQLTREVFGLGG